VRRELAAKALRRAGMEAAEAQANGKTMPLTPDIVFAVRSEFGHSAVMAEQWTMRHD